MAESDTHYNGTFDRSSLASRHFNNNAEPVIPLPNPGEGGPVYPGNGNGDAVIPLPNPGEGGPVYPGNGNGDAVIPLPNPGEGGPVYPGNNCGSIVVPVFPNMPNGSMGNYGQVRFLNASTNNFPVNISINNTLYSVNSQFGCATNYDWVIDGFHTVTIRRATGLRNILLQQTFPFVANQKATMVLTDSPSGGLEMIRISDTGCTNLPSSSGCYRFSNMAYGGSSFDLLLYGGETVFRNVKFQTTTPYKQAIAGTYQFYVTNSNTYTFINELPIIVIGAVATNVNMRDTLVSFSAKINPGRNYTSYIIGNTWSQNNLHIITLED